jgi:peptide-methionine (S)-S-oxide reductase
MDKKNIEIITLGAGCFWCVEAVFQQLKGVEQVISGYMGGQNENPTYEQICTGTTGHVEVCQLHYDTLQVSIDEILEVYWQTHDPTTLNQQGADKGTQYRSVIFYHTDLQRVVAENYKASLDTSGAFANPIVTTIEPTSTFYKAEDYHQNYYNNHSNQSYCYYVIKPKLEKFNKVFFDKKRNNG